MEMVKYYEKQKELDSYIMDKQNITGREVFLEKKIALLVELGEFANEVRAFKFWSTKDKSPKDVITEEYIDALHFMLSIGLDLDLIIEKITPEDIYFYQTYSHLELLEIVYSDVSNMLDDISYKEYYEIFTKFIALSRNLGIDKDYLEEIYDKKNEINFKRQDSNY